MSEWWRYENLESKAPYNWEPAGRGDHPDDNIDFHLDLGAGKLPKGRLTIDLRGKPDIIMDLNNLLHGPCYATKDRYIQKRPGYLPFPRNSIHSIVSHHCLEHIGTGFICLMDECYRVLQPGGKFRIIVPLFPSLSAINDPDHVRYFCVDTFEAFVHDAPSDVPFWSEAFSTPYTSARFKLAHKNYTHSATLYEILKEKKGLENFPDLNDKEKLQTITIDDLFQKGREIRVTLQKPNEA